MITQHTAETLIAFENRIRNIFGAGELPFLVHLSGGNEAQLLEIFRDVERHDWVFSTHRSHYHALLKGISPNQLEQDIREGRSMFVFSAEHHFFTSSILAGICPIAVGVALANKRAGNDSHVWCFVGDGSEDNGHFCEAVRYATGHDLPITFVIEDNDRQVDTSYAERWGTAERWQWGSKVKRYAYVPTYPHGGAGLPPGSVTFKPEAVERFARR